MGRYGWYKAISQLEPKERPEIVLNYTKNEFGEIHTNISYDQELSMERKKLEKIWIFYMITYFLYF